MKLNIYNQNGEVKGQKELSDKIFAVKANTVLINEAVTAQLANMRQVLAHTKTRSEVRGGGKKPWRQKGTGRARAGSSRSPLWRGGGIIFGPDSDRNFSKKINKKAKQKAMFMVLSDKAANNALVILEKPVLENFKTKIFNGILNNLESAFAKASPFAKATGDKSADKSAFAKASSSAKATGDKPADKGKIKNGKKRTIKRSILFINDAKDLKVTNSGRNLAGVKIINLENINTVDLLNYKNVIFTDEAVDKLEEIYK
ncbi:MAG TPA: 50S ribosomal protein L4 [Candidatus Nanoarchaeia archaeon]|nr:50S ribosomal protein L4 [Candidatus Nanoarchaeia archaeon]